MTDDVLGYRGTRVAVTGAASGMGAATAKILVSLGAEVHGLDIKPTDVDGLAGSHVCDLREPESIAAAVEALGSPLDALFNCAGLPQTFPDMDVMLVNFCGTRELTERLIPTMAPGSAICTVASVAGMGWMERLDVVMSWVDTDGFEAARRWCDAHPELVADAYNITKEALNVYTMARASSLLAQGIRINCINPGPTDTPFVRHIEHQLGRDFLEALPKPIGRNARPDEMGWVMAMLNSPRASYLAGQAVFVDGGFAAGVMTGQIDLEQAFALDKA